MSSHGRCANRECPNSKKSVTLPAMGLCGACYGKVRAHKMAWPPEREETGQVGGGQINEITSATCAHNAEKINETTNRQGAASQVEPSENIGGLPGTDHISQPGKMAPDLPEDLDRPFTVAGINFVPAQPKRTMGDPIVTIRNKSIIAISAAAAIKYKLRDFSHARLVPSDDGAAIGVKFFHASRPGAVRAQRKERLGVTLSAQAFLRGVPGLIGMKATLEPTEWDGFFVARFGGEAA